jgi:hypothetical protein
MRDWESDLLLRETQLAHSEALIRSRETRLGFLAAFACQAAPNNFFAANACGATDPSNRGCSESGVAATRPAVILAPLPKLVVGNLSCSVGCENGCDICGEGGHDNSGGVVGVCCRNSNPCCNFSVNCYSSCVEETTLNMLAVTKIFEQERLALLEEFSGYAIITPASPSISYAAWKMITGVT